MPSMSHEDRRKRRVLISARIAEGLTVEQVANEFKVCLRTVMLAAREFGASERQEKEKVEYLAIPAVYLIRNTDTGDSYVGASMNVRRRIAAHVSFIYSLKSSNAQYTKAFCANPMHGIEIRILEKVRMLPSLTTPAMRLNHLLDRECYWIRKLNPVANTQQKAPFNRAG